LSITAALIGLGKIGFKYRTHELTSKCSVTHFEALAKNPKINLVFASDIEAEKCISFTKQTQTLASVDITSLLRQFQPSIVTIATPSTTRQSFVEEVLSEWRPLALILEKPLTATLESSLALSDVLKKTGIKVFVNYQRNYSPAFQALRLELADPRVGKIIEVRGTYSGTLINAGSHLIALLHLLVGPIDCKNPTYFSGANLFQFHNGGTRVQLYQLTGYPGYELSFEITTEKHQYVYSSSRNYLEKRSLVESREYEGEFYFDTGINYCEAEDLNSGIDHLYQNVVSFIINEDHYCVTMDEALSFENIINALQAERPDHV
jgi:predicted dehydrogenase